MDNLILPPHHPIAAAAKVNRDRRRQGVPARQDDRQRGKRTGEARRTPTSGSSSGLMASAPSRAKNQAIGYVAKGRPKTPAQMSDITGGSIERSLAARGDKIDFAGCRRRPRTEPGHSGRSTQRWSARGRKFVASSRRRWMRGTGKPSPPRLSGDSARILWMAICGTSKGCHDRRGAESSLGIQTAGD